MREWEEEQVRLDRDWYSGAEEGGVAGDEEHNPLAQYEDLSVIKETEIATKIRVSTDLFLRSKSYSFPNTEENLGQAGPVCEYSTPLYHMISFTEPRLER